MERIGRLSDQAPGNDATTQLFYLRQTIHSSYSSLSYVTVLLISIPTILILSSIVPLIHESIV